ncbi:hypothetical protein K438DRAFT_806174 [Mycena galopus ATCC 62051]|nr:hypothetical protein K438DRAFT_806174 [Mycena galopus ATCC 62051]
MRMGEMGEEELRGMGAPPALRPAARALRQEVLASSSSTSLSSSSSVSDDEGTSNSPFRRGGSTSPTRPRVSAVYEEPGEIEDADGDADLDPQDDGTPSHRRRTMSVPVASPFANATSSSSPFAPKHKQSPFASRYEYPTNGDDGRGRASPSPSPSPTGRFRNGRVKGMVRSFESSGSESGSPERDRERGSGFRNVNASANGSGSGFRNEGGSGFLRRKASQSEGEDDDVGGTVRPHAHIQAQGTGSSGNGRALPVRPDSASAYGYGYSKAHVDVLDLGATVRGPVLVPVPMHAHGFLGTASSNGTGTTPQDKDQDEEELTVEELIAREDAVGGIGMGVGMSMGSMTPNHTGGAWRKGSSKRGLGVGMGMGMSPQSTGGSGNGNSIEGRHPTGGRPLPAHPTASSAAYAQHTQQRTSSGGVHAWEADEGATGSTVKWVPARAGVASHVFADVEGTDADADVGGKGGEGERIAEESEKDLEAEQERERVVEESEKDLEAERERERAAKNLAREEAHEKKKQQRAREAEAEEPRPLRTHITTTSLRYVLLPSLTPIPYLFSSHMHTWYS